AILFWASRSRIKLTVKPAKRELAPLVIVKPAKRELAPLVTVKPAKRELAPLTKKRVWQLSK
ncbi:MAG: hypothetical protein SNG14_06270, partial [Rikenellaceae bacterium]